VDSEVAKYSVLVLLNSVLARSVSTVVKLPSQLTSTVGFSAMHSL